MLSKLKSRLFGSSNERQIKKYKPIVDQINSLENEFSDLSDEQLKLKTKIFKDRLSKNENLNPAKVKEPNYFSNKITKNISWYKKLWDKKSKGLKFECSANYIYSKDAIENLIKEYPL